MKKMMEQKFVLGLIRLIFLFQVLKFLVNLDDLKKMKYVTFVTSTSGEGEFPPNATEFWKRLSKANKNDTSLVDMKFAVLGLGDSSYTKFCEAARLVNEKFEELGGKRFFPFTTYDDQSNKDQEEFVNHWIQDILKILNNGHDNNKPKVSTSTSVKSNESNMKTKENKVETIEKINIQKCDLQTEIHIIYGTKTNHSRDIANKISSDAKNAGMPYVYVHEANTVKVEDLIKMKNIVFIAPTYSGLLPEDTLKFWDIFSKKTPESMDMSEVRYTVLGIGYSTSPRYCIATKAVNQKFKELGSSEFYPYTELDVEHAKNSEQIINDWSGKLLNSLIDIENREVQEDIGRRRLINNSDDQLNIIFGTESEHAQDVAGMLSDEVKEAGLNNINIFSADRIQLSDLRKMKTLIIVTSTFKGTFPPNALKFWERLSKVNKSDAGLENTKYAVFGLGDSTREKYCEAARLLDEKFNSLGAKRIHKLATLDNHANYDQIEVINKWIHEILDIILPGMKKNNNKINISKTDNKNKNTELHVIFGTKSTHAEDAASIVVLDAIDAGFSSVYSHEANTITVEDLLKMKNIVFITSTIDGDFPPDTVEFWKKFSKKTKETMDMSKINYSVLGVGDKNKKDYCAAAKKLNEQFKKLGAKEFNPYTEVDIEHNEDPGTLVSNWTKRLLNNLEKSTNN